MDSNFYIFKLYKTIYKIVIKKSLCRNKGETSCINVSLHNIWYSYYFKGEETIQTALGLSPDGLFPDMLYLDGQYPDTIFFQKDFQLTLNNFSRNKAENAGLWQEKMGATWEGGGAGENEGNTVSLTNISLLILIQN